MRRSIQCRFLHFPVLHFPPLHIGAAFSSPAFSIPAVWCRIFRSRIFSVPDATLLGAPLFVGSVLDNAWSSRCMELSRAVNRLKSVGAQDSLILLRASFSASRVQHLIRCSPSVDNPALEEFDKLLRSAVSHLTNCNLSDDQWRQASLPVKIGGLGVRRVSSLAPQALEALQDTILMLATYAHRMTCSRSTAPDGCLYQELFCHQMRTCCPRNSPSGTDRVSHVTDSPLSTPRSMLLRKHNCWLLPHLTAVIGCWLFRSHRADSDWTTRLFKWRCRSDWA